MIIVRRKRLQDILKEILYTVKYNSANNIFFLKKTLEKTRKTMLHGY